MRNAAPKKEERLITHSATRLALAILACGIIGAILFDLAVVEAQQGSRLSATEQATEPTGDFSKFLHASPNHSRLPCLLCHRRENAGARPSLPGASGHLPCAGCHAQQFANNESPICGICHTDARTGAVKSFPRLKSFRVNFDHARHLKMGSVSCATCHRPARGGVSFSIPAGFNAHTTCYRCHNPRASSGGRDISSCGTCHKLGSYSPTPAWTAAFRMNFSHAKHGAAQKLNCDDCHNVRAGMPQRRQVTVPEAANHHASGRTQSCMTCHDGKRAFGGDDFSTCKRCHTGNTWHF
jgi:c(7)-type cytochrome triheme protein